MKVKFVINGESFDDIEMPQHPQVGNYVTWAGGTTEVKEVEYIVERKGFFIRVVVRCVGDFATSRWSSIETMIKPR